MGGEIASLVQGSVPVIAVLGAIVAVYRGWALARKTQREGDRLGTLTAPEVADKSVTMLTAVNERLEAENARVKEEREYYRQRLVEVQAQVENLAAELTRAQEVAARLQIEVSNLSQLLNSDTRKEVMDGTDEG